MVVTPKVLERRVRCPVEALFIKGEGSETPPLRPYRQACFTIEGKLTMARGTECGDDRSVDFDTVIVDSMEVEPTCPYRQGLVLMESKLW